MTSHLSFRGARSVNPEPTTDLENVGSMGSGLRYAAPE